jgi:hypothetical protein
MKDSVIMIIQKRPLILLSCLIVAGLLSIVDGRAETGRAPVGKGSLPSRLFSDRTVCLVNPEKPFVCKEWLFKVPPSVMKAHSLTFYGAFDVDGDGLPEVFLDYWSPLDSQDEDNVVLLVYKKLRGKYRQYLKLKAESLGYAPAGWFIKEPPHAKAIFMTRYGGSSGTGLFYLNLRERSLDLISSPMYLEGCPEFLDMDGDGIAEIFLEGRGRDRTSNPGAALLRWKDEGYTMWWPNWTGTPTVIYATLADVDGDGKKEIVAVLEPEGIDLDEYIQGETAMPRELGVWRVETGGITQISKTKLPDSKHISYPTIGRVPPRGQTVELEYPCAVGCALVDGKLTCQEEDQSNK